MKLAKAEYILRAKLRANFDATNAKEWVPFGGLRANPGVWSWQGNGTRTVEKSTCGQFRVSYSHGHSSTSLCSSGTVIFSKEKTPLALLVEDERQLPLSLSFPE